MSPPGFSPIVAEIRLTKGALPFVGTLTPTQRLLAAYSVAEQAGVTLALDSDLTGGHRLAIYAHLNVIADRHGCDAALELLDSLAADMIARAAGRRDWRPGTVAQDAADPTDWATVKVSD